MEFPTTSSSGTPCGALDYYQMFGRWTASALLAELEGLSRERRGTIGSSISADGSIRNLVPILFSKPALYFYNSGKELVGPDIIWCHSAPLDCRAMRLRDKVVAD